MSGESNVVTVAVCSSSSSHGQSVAAPFPLGRHWQNLAPLGPRPPMSNDNHRRVQKNGADDGWAARPLENVKFQVVK